MPSNGFHDTKPLRILFLCSAVERNSANRLSLVMSFISTCQVVDETKPHHLTVSTLHFFLPKNCLQRQGRLQVWWSIQHNPKERIPCGCFRNSGTPKWMVYIYGKTLLELMIWGYPYFWKHPCTVFRNRMFLRQGLRFACLMLGNKVKHILPSGAATWWLTTVKW